jgi:hypothetical protein
MQSSPTDEHIDEAKALTVARGEGHVVEDSSWGRITWAEWCDKEMERYNAKGNGRKVRIARGFGYVWLTAV